MIRLLLAWLLLVPTGLAVAHQASDAYLRAGSDAQGRLTLQVEVALRDLDLLLELDADGDGELRWGEVRRREADIAAQLVGALRVDDGRCALRARPGLALDRKADGSYAVLAFDSDCAVAAAPRLAYGLMRGVDPTHRGLLVEVDAGGRTSGPLRSLAPGGTPVALLASAGGAAAPPANAGFFTDGLHHILIGADHVLFLVCLMLPLILRREAAAGAGWQASAWPLLALVTAFTVGHSITLGLASWRVLSAPPSLIEPLIALTIALTAIDNLWPILGRRRALAAFAFGLIHGFGFAGPLLELDLAPWAVAGALLQFNLGVEAGQLIVVALAMTLLWPLRQGRGALPVLRGGSALAGVLALLWLGERVLGVELLPL